MPIPINQIKKGRYYATGSGQLRRVDRITRDKNNRKRVQYSSKSIRIRGRSFSPAGTIANPALEETFAKACAKRLSAGEVKKLRKNGILLTGE
jgi:hypothetical protein